MYSQQDLDSIYISNAMAYEEALRIERIRNYFSIVASVFTVVLAIHLMLKK